MRGSVMPFECVADDGEDSRAVVLLHRSRSGPGLDPTLKVPAPFCWAGLGQGFSYRSRSIGQARLVLSDSATPSSAASFCISLHSAG